MILRTDMPIYTFRNKKTGVTYTEFMKIAEMLEHVKDPDVEQHIGAPLIVSGFALKPDAGFKDVLKKIKDNNVRSNIDTF